MSGSRTPVFGAVEGDVDEAILTRLTGDAGLDIDPSRVHGRKGTADLVRRLPGFNEAARRTTWIVLIDLDDDASCAPPARRNWILQPSSGMELRIAVREVEAWLLADRERFASFFKLPLARIPAAPENILQPKKFVAKLATESKSRAIREGMAPRLGSGRDVGPVYSSRLMEFVEDRTHGWRPQVAARSADSLERCMRRLAEIALVEG